MTEGGKGGPEPPEEGNRTAENAVMLGFFVVLVVAGIWLLGTMADVRKAQDCAARGGGIVRQSRFPTRDDKIGRLN